MMPDAATLVGWMRDARARSLAALAGLDAAQQLGPCLLIVNPPRWELGHVAWFNERWAWRHLRGLPPLRADGDALYDSAKVAHDTRWHLPLPTWAETEAYGRTIVERLVEKLSGHEPDAEERYFHQLAVFHEDMHGEAFLYTRQTLAYTPPAIDPAPPPPVVSRVEGDAKVPGGEFSLGAAPGEAFVFDNEKWAHPVRLEPFRIARRPVTNAEFAAFVADGGYRRPELWAPEGWRWRERVRAEHPVYWREMSSGWEVRVFDRWHPLPPDHPIIHVNWYEADAYCRWAQRRLPTETEWEAAAAGEPSPDGRSLAPRKRPYPWGEAPPGVEQANLDACHVGTVSVHAYAAGDSAFGCRQMWGNVWEWTATDFQPYPGFVVDPYREYSAPWFGNHKVLRGGCWATRARLLRNTWRNFYTPDRRDVLAGFRTCAR
jgi:iron(II)-dependent oxidoreductase